MAMPVGVYPFSRAGVYTGDQFNTWLGTPAIRRTAYLPYDKGWAAVQNSINGPYGLTSWLKNSGGSPVSINIGMGGSLEEFVANKPDATGKRPTDYLLQTAKDISAAYPLTQSKIDVVYPWEADGSWYSWTFVGREDTYKTCCKMIHDIFKGVDTRFYFWFCIASRQLVMDGSGVWRPVNPMNAHPGWNYVDGLAVDLYRLPRTRPAGVLGPTDPGDDLTTWSHKLNDPYGIAWMVSKADGMGKGKRINELGVAIDAPDFMRSALTYCAAHNIDVNIFNTSDGRDDFTISTGRYPNTAAVLKTYCGGTP